MSILTNNLNSILSIKADIKSAIEAKGVDMTGISFPDYASKIGEISGGSLNMEVPVVIEIDLDLGN